jgi:hypothetical protein
MQNYNVVLPAFFALAHLALAAAARADLQHFWFELPRRK